MTHWLTLAVLGLAAAALAPVEASACTYSPPAPSEAKARASSAVIVSGRYDYREETDARSEDTWWGGTITAAKVSKGLVRSSYTISNRADLMEGCPRSWLPDVDRHPQRYRGTFFLERAGPSTYLIIKFVPVAMHKMRR